MNSSAQHVSGLPDQGGRREEEQKAPCDPGQVIEDEDQIFGDDERPGYEDPEHVQQGENDSDAAMDRADDVLRKFNGHRS